MEPTGPARLLTAPQPLDRLDALFEPPAAFFERNLEHVEFVWQEPRCKPGVQPTMRQVVQHRQFRRKRDWMTECWNQASGDQAHTTGVLSNRTEERDWIRAIATVREQVMLGDLDRMKPQFVRLAAQIEAL